MAKYLAANAPVSIIDEGHRRTIDLALDNPAQRVETVMSNEVWEDYYDRLTQLILEHKTTLVFVNTRRMAERVARISAIASAKTPSPRITAACRKKTPRCRVAPEERAG